MAVRLGAAAEAAAGVCSVIGHASRRRMWLMQGVSLRHMQSVVIDVLALVARAQSIPSDPYCWV